MACNESFQQAISHALQTLATPSVVLKPEQRAISQLFACTLHTRFGEPLSSFNIISNRALILDASLSWLAFFTKQRYSMMAISHRGSAKAVHQCLLLEFRQSTHS